MEELRIQGGTPLRGSVRVNGAKNAALPIMAASILAGQPVLLDDVPRLSDVDTLALLLGHLGVEVKRTADGALRIETIDTAPTTAGYALVSRMRASFCVLGPLLARRRRAVVSLPGGCNLGARPVDLHLAGLEALGASIRIERGYVVAESKRLIGAEIALRGPRGPTVTGTANVMSAAALARGRTIIRHAAREPEIVDLGRFLVALGADIRGLGSDTIEIVGVETLGGTRHRVIPDRIETATLMVAAIISGGCVTLNGARPDHLAAVLEVLTASGAAVVCDDGRIRVAAGRALRPIRLKAGPFPAVPTDVQAQLTALAAVARGRSFVADSVFPERFLHVDELARLGARIRRGAAGATIEGVAGLSGATVKACDLRASAALVLAGLVAGGTTIVRAVHHLDRGYERLDRKLAQLGASIERRGAACPRVRRCAPSPRALGASES